MLLDRVRRALAVVLAAAFAYPLVLMLAKPDLESYRLAFEWVPLGRALLNSLLVLALALPLTLAVASAAGLGLALLGPRRQAVALTALLLVASIPLTAIWIPRFVLFEALGWSGTYAPLVAPGLAGGSALYVLLFFLAARRIPAELFEAARLEGLGAVALWWRVALPLTRPTAFAVGVLAGVQIWGNFVEAVLYLNAERSLTAPLMLHSLELLGSTQWPVLMAGAAVVTAPVVVALLALQRFLAAPEREGPWLGR